MIDNLANRSHQAARPDPSSDSVLSASQIWGAAAYADRINGGKYFKSTDSTQAPIRYCNKELVWDAVADLSLITASDIQTGQDALVYRRQNLIMKSLQDKMSEFDRRMASIVEMTEFRPLSHRYQIAVIASQIKSWRDDVRRDTFMSDVVRTPVAEVGARVLLEAQVIDCLFSSNFLVYFVTAKTNSKQLVFFSRKKSLEIGEHITIKGYVKEHRSDGCARLKRVRTWHE